MIEKLIEPPEAGDDKNITNNTILTQTGNSQQHCTTHLKYENDFLLSDLENTIKSIKHKKSATGNDGIDYEIIQKLTKHYQIHLLNIINEIWNGGEIPDEWKETIVIMIEKPKKKALRPIALTNCLGNIAEKIINERIKAWAEDEEIMDPDQNGFRKGRSTLDNLIMYYVNEDQTGFRTGKGLHRNITGRKICI